MNYGDKHTEDSLVSRLGRLYGIERGLDCGPKIRKDVKPLSDNGYIHYLRLFAKKWVRKREEE